MVCKWFWCTLQFGPVITESIAELLCGLAMFGNCHVRLPLLVIAYAQKSVRYESLTLCHESILLSWSSGIYHGGIDSSWFTLFVMRL